MPALKGKSIKKTNIIDLVIMAGVVGAGGAGFPTHVKLSGNAEIVIANGAECEPLLESDRHLMLRQPEKIINGLKAVVEAVGAKKGIIALKKKNSDIAAVIKTLIAQENKLDLFFLDNFYPAGDEHVLVYEVTGRVVPMGGIPLNVGVVVNNVYTLALTADAIVGKSFTHRYVTVTGAVKRPAVAELPIGMSIQEAIDIIGGGASSMSNKVIIGGPMMGKIEEDTAKPITKTTSGIIVLHQNSRLINLKSTSLAAAVKRGKSVCCQCSFCTEICPRFLLGHKIKPHIMMRILPSTDIGIVNAESIYNSSLCSECGLCGYYSCTMGLAPNQINSLLKSILSKNNIKPDFKDSIIKEVNNFRQERKVPTNRLIAKLGLTEYDRHLPFVEENYTPKRLIIPLKQHIGAASVPVVNVGESIKAGSLLAGITENSLGSNIHCPLDGKVLEVSKDAIVVQCS